MSDRQKKNKKTNKHNRLVAFVIHSATFQVTSIVIFLELKSESELDCVKKPSMGHINMLLCKVCNILRFATYFAGINSLQFPIQQTRRQATKLQVRAQNGGTWLKTVR